MVDVRPERFSNPSTTRTNAGLPKRASKVRRGDLVAEAKDQSFRYRNDLGLPNQVCLFRPRPDSACEPALQYAGAVAHRICPLTNARTLSADRNLRAVRFEDNSEG